MKAPGRGALVAARVLSKLDVEHLMCSGRALALIGSLLSCRPEDPREVYAKPVVVPTQGTFAPGPMGSGTSDSPKPSSRDGGVVPLIPATEGSTANDASIVASEDAAAAAATSDECSARDTEVCEEHTGESASDAGSKPSKPSHPTADDQGAPSEPARDAATQSEGPALDSGMSPMPVPETDACGARPASERAFTRKALREAAAACADWHYCKYQAITEELDDRVQQYADAPDETTLGAAKESWQRAMTWWSRVELFQFGPLASKSESAGKDMYEGQGLRDFIYAWPTTSRCRIEEQLVSENYASRGMSGVLISGRGLFALEYLLYYPGSDTECVAASSTGTQWATLSSAELQQRKRNYAVALASDSLEQISKLRELWAADGENFTATFVDAGGMYPDEQEVMKVLAWALIYVEREVKDWKLGIPAGYTLNHPVTLAESPYAGLGTDALRANLEGFRSLFQGCGEDGEGLGFDDWLSAVDHPELASEMVEAMNAARAAALDFPPIAQATPEQLEALYQKVRALTSLLKSDFFGAGSPVNLELPGGVQSDTD